MKNKKISSNLPSKIIESEISNKLEIKTLTDSVPGMGYRGYPDWSEKFKNNLQDLKDEWENIFQAIGQPTLIIDPKHNIISANRAVVKASKLPINEIIGNKCHKIFHDNNKPHKCCPIKKMIKSKHIETVEMIIEALGGTYLISCTPIFNKADKLQKIIHIATDVTKQREMSEAVKKSEERYRTIFEGAVEGIIIADIKTKKFLYANSAICKMLGYKEKELTKLSVSDIHPENRLAKIISEFEAQSRGEKSLSANIPCLKKDGSIIYVNIATSTMLIDGKKCNIGFFTNITEQKKIEETLRIKEKAIADSINGVVLSDIKGTIFYANESFCKLWNYENTNEILGRSVVECWQYPEQALDIIDKINKAGYWRGELKGKKKDGSLFWAQTSASIVKDDMGLPICIMASFIDITEKHKAEEERLNNLYYFESMHKISAIIEKTVDFEDTLNKVLNEILHILNGDRAWLLYPLDPESPSFKAPFEATRPEYPGIFIKHDEIPMNPTLKDMMKTILDSNAPVTYSPNTRPMPGAEVHTKYSVKTQMAIAIRTKFDKPWILGIHQCSHIREWSEEDQKIFKDIAEKITSALNNILLFKSLQKSEESLKIAHEELEKKYEELKKVDKIKDNLLSDVTHELKTPVAKQNMQIELLKRFLKEKGILENAVGIIKTMESSIERQNNVIENILNLARLERGGKKYKFETMRIDLELQKAIDEYKNVLESYKFKIETELPQIEISSDKEMLFHVFANLVNNTIKFKNIETTPYLGIFLEKNDKKVIIRIKDNGIGLTKEELERAFERFYQVSSSAPGSGIGLSIAKMIVDDLKGKIWLESEGKDKGTTAFVELPL